MNQSNSLDEWSKYFLDNSKNVPKVIALNNLLDILEKAHENAAQRENASTQILKGTYQVNGHNMIASITAALQSFGGLHAPIKDVFKFINRYCRDEVFLQYHKLIEVIEFTELQENPHYRLSGFGSAFFKQEMDPLLIELDQWFDQNFPEYSGMKGSCEVILYKVRGIHLYANLAWYTAAASHVLGLTEETCEAIMIPARVKAWTEILINLIPPNTPE